MKLCNPTLQTDAESLNARLTRLEEQISSGKLVVQNMSAVSAETAPWEEEELPPFPDDADAPWCEDDAAQPMRSASDGKEPTGFWPDLVSALRTEFMPPVRGFFAVNGPIHPELKGDVLNLAADSEFVKNMIGKPDILQTVGQKASALLGRPVRVTAGIVGSSVIPGHDRLDDLIALGNQLGDKFTMK